MNDQPTADIYNIYEVFWDLGIREGVELRTEGFYLNGELLLPKEISQSEEKGAIRQFILRKLPSKQA